MAHFHLPVVRGKPLILRFIRLHHFPLIILQLILMGIISANPMDIPRLLASLPMGFPSMVHMAIHLQLTVQVR